MHAAYLDDLAIEHLHHCAVGHLNHPPVRVFELEKLSVWQLHHQTFIAVRTGDVATISAILYVQRFCVSFKQRAECGVWVLWLQCVCHTVSG